MSEGSPKTLWDRVRQALEGEPDGGDGIDEGELTAFLLFVAPVFLAFVALVRR